MGTLGSATPSPGAEWLPPEVLEALNSSAVSGIEALKRSCGLGLLEAKLAIDAFLQHHPEHPAALRRNHLPAVHHTPTEKDGEVLNEVDRIAAEPPAFECSPNRICLPSFYVVAQAALADGGRWFFDAFRVCRDGVNDQSLVEVVDQNQCGKSGHITAAVLKISEAMSSSAIEKLARRLEQQVRGEVSYRLVRAAGLDDVSVSPEQLVVEYFPRELSSKNCMVVPSASCVKLTHQPSGVSARSTLHPLRVLNYEEALFLLVSLVQDANLAPQETAPSS